MFSEFTASKSVNSSLWLNRLQIALIKPGSATISLDFTKHNLLMKIQTRIWMLSSFWLQSWWSGLVMPTGRDFSARPGPARWPFGPARPGPARPGPRSWIFFNFGPARPGPARPVQISIPTFCYLKLIELLSFLLLNIQLIFWKYFHLW